MSMENLFSSIEAGKVTTLNLIIKADVQGSVEAVKQAMEKLILQTDKSRSKFYEYYSHEPWGAADNYHLCINTSVVGVDGAVEIIMKFVEEFRKKNLMPDNLD